MPLAAQQVEDYTAQAQALRIKLQTVAEDVKLIRTRAAAAQEDPSKLHMILAQVARATELNTEFSNAWDRIVLINAKLELSDFPSTQERAMRTNFLSDFDSIRALEIHLKREPPCPPSTASKQDGTFSACETSSWSRQFLERLHLPNFSGDIKAWVPFRDIFTSLVHNDPSIPQVAKLHLLISSLSGEARSIISNFEISDASYPLAWAALTKQYNNTRVLASAFLDNILNFRLPSNPSLRDLQDFNSNVADSLSAFRALKLPDPEDKVLSLIVLKTLDPQNRRRFELQQVDNEFPTLDAIVDFVRNQCIALKLSGECDPRLKSDTKTGLKRQNFPSRSSPKYTSSSSFHRSYHTSFGTQPSSTVSRPPSPKAKSSGRNRLHRDQQPKDCTKKEAQPQPCPFCQQDHILYRCPSFSGLSSQDRLSFASKWQGCHNCLSAEHKTGECKSKFNCRICKQRHHTLLHVMSNPCSPDSSNFCSHSKSTSAHQEAVILGTARAIYRDFTGRIHHIRILLDCGSQYSYISRSCAECLLLKIMPTTSSVSGLGGSHVAEISGRTSLALMPVSGVSRVTITVSVLEKVTSQLPQEPVPRHIIEKFNSMNLADPNFHQPHEIDILLGADYFDSVVTGTFYKPDPFGPSALPTLFGMVIMGSYRSQSSSVPMTFLCRETQQLSSQLRAFWELEEPAPVSRVSPTDALCEEHFRTTHTRDATGRYMVRLPFATSPEALGDNRLIAKKRLFYLESKMSTNEKLGDEYRKFMEEYEELNHMTVAPLPSSYIIPHFGIMQKKLRVVFDASCPSTNMSLNDILLSGPKLQTDICDVLSHFRLFPVAVTTDMVKMYRQILVHPEDRKYQHIFWRNSPASKLIEYELNTVTYGEGPSAFLAIRTVQQLLQDEGHNFPLATQKLRKAIFVDDICTGADNEVEAAQLCTQLISLFAAGGFPLSKWSSNCPAVLPEEGVTTNQPLVIQPDEIPSIKVLGLIWNPAGDSFSYTVHQPPVTHLSKRSILSFIARMFDPLGFLAPVILRAKIFLQELWKRQLDWDDQISEDLAKRWFSFATSWESLADIRIPRYLSSRHRVCNLVGFSDASKVGYAAVLYLQVQESQEHFESFIIKAKSKVAPARFVSIPRLELCGAHLLAKLVCSMNLAPDLLVSHTYLFCDSRVALAWIHTPTHLLKVFEANRVADIGELAPDVQWRYVKSRENPADMASKGLNPSEISGMALWWTGPPWLELSSDSWPQQNYEVIDDPMLDLAEHSSFHTAKKSLIDSSWIERFSRLQLLLRVVTRMLRFVRKSHLASGNFSDPITAPELQHALKVCAKSTQLHLLPLGTKTPQLLALNPFYDQAGILRVGGRLQNAPISFDEQHPIIIPKSSHLARLIVKDIHERYYHAGPTLTLSMLRTKFWIPSSLRFVKGQISRCVTCFKRKPVPQKAIMAPLPSIRFSTGRAFQQIGIDFAGPFILRDSLRRKPNLSKGYLCLFICLSTKALHLEAVSALTTEAFLACLDRFIARRGRPNIILTDNATNFIGASRYLKDLSIFLHSQHDSIVTHLSTSGVEWQFIPPRSPHFGGIWEAGVKSVKSLLVSSTGSQTFTYEELSTILSRIEGILNSRPLCPLSEDPDSLDALTPGHFLIGSATYFLPEERLEDLPDSRLSRWQHVQKQVQHVWSRWRQEYLNTLQQRTRWQKSSSNLQVNDLVILLEKKSPPGHWPLARVVEVHPGSDGTVRVVSIKTSSGSIFKRSIHNLAKLPISNSSSY